MSRIFLIALVCLAQVLRPSATAKESCINCLPQPDQCVDYQILDDATRNIQHGHEDYCDDSELATGPDWRGPGWYRMLPPAGTMMPQVTPQPDHCGTTRAGWLDGQHPTGVYQTTSNVRVCFDIDLESDYVLRLCV